jgi:hypothetical protein
MQGREVPVVEGEEGEETELVANGSGQEEEDAEEE